MGKDAIFIILIFLAGFVHAKPPEVQLLFGPEFTFQTPPEGQHDYLERFFHRMRDHLVYGQLPGARFRTIGKRVFISPNGWEYELSVDLSVVEIKMKPMTVYDFTRFAADIEDAIFVSARNEQSYPALFLGGGHINIDIHDLMEHPLLLRNFIVDLHNHNELFMGIFNYDTHNALPYPLFPESHKIKFIKVIEDFDAGAYAPVAAGTFRFLKDIKKAFWEMHDPYLHMWGKYYISRTRWVAINFLNADSLPRGRLELRGVRPQQSIYTWLAQIRLLQARLNYLSRLNEPIPLKLETPVLPISDPNDALLVPPVNPQKALESFHRYLSEAGEKWEDHRDYLWPKWITDGEVEKYEKSKRFADLEKKRACEFALLP